MNKSQIRFAMAAHAAWIVMKNPVLTRVYMEQWERMYPRPLSVEGAELSLYGYVFQDDVQGSMSKATRERNQSIRQEFYQLYGTMPIMLLYATLGNKHEVSEHTIRSILNNRWK